MNIKQELQNGSDKLSFFQELYTNAKAKLEDSFAEAEYYLNIDEYDVYSSFNGSPF